MTGKGDGHELIFGEVGKGYAQPHRRSRIATHHQLANTDKNNLNFGHGKCACLGRFFASNTVKLVLAHLLFLKHEIRFPLGRGIPGNVTRMSMFFRIWWDRESLKRRRMLMRVGLPDAW